MYFLSVTLIIFIYTAVLSNQNLCEDNFCETLARKSVTWLDDIKYDVLNFFWPSQKQRLKFSRNVCYEIFLGGIFLLSVFVMCNAMLSQMVWWMNRKWQTAWHCWSYFVLWIYYQGITSWSGHICNAFICDLSIPDLTLNYCCLCMASMSGSNSVNQNSMIQFGSL